MNLTIRSVVSKKDLNEFVSLPWKLYKSNKCWVPPLRKDMMEMIDVQKNPSLNRIEHEMFIAYLDNKPAGRIFTGIDHTLNSKKNEAMGYFSLFESINNQDVANLIFDTAVSWMQDRNISIVRGPVSPTGADSDEYKGLLINCFDRPPVLMNSYNPEYYIDLFESYGFTKDYDVFAYFLHPEKTFTRDPSKVIEYSQKKCNFRIDTIDLNNLEREIKDIKYVMDIGVPDEWPDMVAPSLEDVRAMADKLVSVADPDLITIARSGDRPIGFGLALPDYNQILIHLNGRITPLAALKYLWYKRKINCARFFAIFVIPEFRKKGVSYAIYYQTFLNARKKGYIYGEGSTIGEINYRMRKDIESFGGEHYKTYRIYGKEIK